MKRVITYGTFDVLHYGHIELLRRCKDLAKGGELIVALSSDKFNSTKGKKSHLKYFKRKQLLEAIKYVDKIIPENNWEQKCSDIKKHKVDIFVMGNDWKGKFDHLEDLCEVHYLPRTNKISSTAIKRVISLIGNITNEIEDIEQSVLEVNK